MEDLIDKLITLGVVLGFWAIGYLVRLFAGFKNIRKRGVKWNWVQFRDGLLDRFCWLVATFGAVIGCEMLKWLMPSMGVSLSPEIILLLDTASVIAIPFVNGVVDLALGIKSIQTSAGWENNAKFLGANLTGGVDYESIAEPIKDFLDTITTKTDREQLVEDGAEPEVLEGEVLSDREAGMGGFANTYPEPYRSAAQDSLTDPSTCYNRECVSYCAWKVKELTGSWLKRTGGMNAKYWVERLRENGYGVVVSRPENGGKYIGVSTAGTYGHVVWFEEDDVISEYNYSIRGGFSVRQINLSAYTWVQIQAPAPAVKPATPAKKPVENKSGEITYTYKSGDTFGQVIRDLGLETSHGLWGTDGDVNYYTEQLHQQGIYGNIAVGTKIKLTRRS